MKVAVVGGGVVGLCSAYSLAHKGFDVDVYDPGDGIATSAVNAGMIVPSHVIPLAAPGMVGYGIRMMLKPRSPFWIRPRLSGNLLRWMIAFARHCTPDHVAKSRQLLADLNLASKAAYLEFAKELSGFEVHETGLLVVAATGHGFSEELRVAAQVRSVGLPVRELDSRDIANFDPGIAIRAKGAVHYPEDCSISPPQFLAALRSRLREIGVRLVPESVQRIGNLDADQVVVAAGVWSSQLVQSLGVRMPLQAGKGYSFDVAAPPARPSIPAILLEGRVAVTPMPDGVRFGGTMEIGPADARIDRARVEGIRETIPTYYPAYRGADIQSQPVRVGLRPCSPDGLPYIGRVSDRVIVASGHAMMGMSLGPITGRLVSQIASGEDPSIDLSALRPDRFA